MSGLEHNPFLNSLGIKIDSWADGEIVLYIDLQPMHLNRQGVLQGGVVSALLDAACGYSGLVPDPEDAKGNGVTITLTVNFIGSVSQGRVMATGKVTGQGRKIYFSQGQVTSEDGRVLATAQGSFKYGAARVK
ncbi:PaaI family thioesterase [Alcaligenaceae bacterium]|nr:PaaI family thioesterase [Alcaligenaceae bacterium]